MATPRREQEEEEEEQQPQQESADRGLIDQLNRLLLPKSAPAVPEPVLERLIPAARTAIFDSRTPLPARDRYELETLLEIAGAIQAEDLNAVKRIVAARLQLLLTSRLHGWAYAKRVQDYQVAIDAGLYAPPPTVPSQAFRAGRSRRGRIRGPTPGRGGRGGFSSAGLP